MKDRRFVDDLSLEELERILFIRRREARLARVRRTERASQRVGRDPLEPPPPPPVPPPVSTAHREYRGVGASAGYRSVELQAERRRRVPAWLAGRPLASLTVNWRFVIRAILLLVEAAAVAGLIIVVISTWQEGNKINADAEALFVPTAPPPSPTPLPPVKAVVLPGGHTPPDARGFSQPEPLPAHLQTQLAEITPEPVPTPGPEHPARIVIPAIGVDHRVVMGDGWEALKQGVGYTPWSAPPGQVGNCILTAHNDIFGGIFRNLPEVELGDEVLIYTSSQTYRYIVQATHVVEPTQTELLAPTDLSILTLISSYPYLVDDKRIVVVAELASP